jgi:hypothetical protein
MGRLSALGTCREAWGRLHTLLSTEPSQSGSPAPTPVPADRPDPESAPAGDYSESTGYVLYGSRCLIVNQSNACPRRA